MGGKTEVPECKECGGNHVTRDIPMRACLIGCELS